MIRILRHFITLLSLLTALASLAPNCTTKGDNRKLPRHWRSRTLSDPAVKAAYSNDVRSVIAYFDPEHLAIGI